MDRKAPVKTPKQLKYRFRGVHNLALSALFLLALLLVLTVNLISPDRDFSESENRMLAQKPDFSWSALWDGSYGAELESYLSDQFAGRDGWMSLKLRLDRLMGRKESGGVYLCEDDYLIEVPTASTPEDAEDTALWRSLDAINAFAAAHPALQFDVMIVPNAISVLSDKLPENAPAGDQPGQMELISHTLSAQIDFLDVTEILCQHADEGMYYHTDHHWTSLAAKYAFDAAAERLGIMEPVQEYKVYTVSDSFEGTLASKSGSHATRDVVQVYDPMGIDIEYYVNYMDTQTRSGSLYQSGALEGKDHYTVFFGGNHGILRIVTTANNGRHLLVFKDSYANCFVPFLVPYYESITMIDPRYYYDSVETVLQTAEITDVLFLYNLNTFVSDTALGDALGAE